MDIISTPLSEYSAHRDADLFALTRCVCRFLAKGQVGLESSDQE